MKIHASRTQSIVAGFALFAFATLGTAQTSKPTTFEELCKYEKLCQQLKDSGGFIKPKKKIIMLMNELREPIKSISAKLGVDPRAVAGAIVAENTMNVQVDDDIQDWLVKLQIAPTASILGKSFTIGLGQIHVEAAAQVEPMVAKIEGRKQRSSKEIADALLTPGGAIAYAAGIIRKAQDDYKAQGIDVSGSPEILTTLYNLGNTDAKARNAQATKQKPRPNYFGFFVQQNLGEISESIEWKKTAAAPVATAVTSNANEPTSAPSSAASGAAKSPNEVPAAAPIATGAPVHSELRTVLTKSVQLSSFSPQCSTAGPGISSDYMKYATIQKSPSNVSAQGEYEVVSRGLDCEMSPWILIRTKDGKVGWLDEKILKASTEKKSLAVGAVCDPNGDLGCLEAVSKIVGKSVLGTTKAHLQEIKLVGAKERPGKVNVKKFHPEVCFNKNKNGMTMGNNGQAPDIALTSEEATALAQKAEDKKADVIKGLGLDKWESTQNLYRNDFDSLISTLKGQCSKGCKGPVDVVKTMLAADFSQYKGLAGFKKFKGLTRGGGLYFSPGQPDPTANLSVKDQWMAYFTTMDTTCQDIFKMAKRSAKALVEAKKAFAESLKTYPSFTNTPPQDSSKTCENLGKILKRREAKKAAASADPNVAMEAKSDADCSNCQIQMTIAYGNGGSMSTSYSLEMMDALLQTPEDFDDLLFDSIDGVKRYFPTSQSSATDMMTCEYDPFESAKRVEELLKLPCVESAFVPDMFILKKLDKYEGRVFHMPFVDEDRFAVRLKNNCEGVTK